ncbi:6-phosphogluconate dehydrogenase C-terminal domain-like protein [Colletotrichum somersetense]|nr:6-phosphogluconate dehydrogenase C-terminal domain-like protein [Colletotrichum somersetense]
MADKRRVLLVGGGGIGAIAALNLERGGAAEVTAVLRSNFDVVSRKGFSITSCDHGTLESWRPSQVSNAVPAVSGPSSAGRYDYAVCCTKNIPDASPSLPDIIAPAVSPGHTIIVLIQNGLNIQRPFFSRFPSNIVLSGVSRIDAHEVSLGVVEQKQHDLLHIGVFQNPSLDEEQQHEAARQFVEIYGAAGAATCLHRPDVDFDRWNKLVYNASFNPICALTGLNASELQMTGRTMGSMVIPAMREVLAVAAAAGHDISEDVIEKTIGLNPVEDNIKPSMQIDFEKGNLIEHENILGEVVREAQEHGVTAPILGVLYEICCAHQWRFKKAKGLI